MATYTMRYRAIPMNVSRGTFAAAWAAVPRDLAFEAALGLALTSDFVTAGPTCVRTIVLHSTGTGPLPDPQPAAALAGVYQQSFVQALKTGLSGVTSDPVVVT
jgi:hypothetical protein